MSIASWCRNNDVWYLKMDIEIPEVCVTEARRVYEEGFFVDHRGGNGWMSSALHGFGSWHHTDTPSTYGVEAEQWGWTEIQELAPETKRWLEDFPHHGYKRCRFMLLKPGGSIGPHHDAVGRPMKHDIASAINLSLYQPRNCYLRRSDTEEVLPFDHYTGFWFDNGVDHEAFNGSDEFRFHFIIHDRGQHRRQELMIRSFVKEHGEAALKEALIG